MFFMSVAAAAAALGSLDVTVWGMAPASEVNRSRVLRTGEGVLPLDISGLTAGIGEGRLGGAPLVAVRQRCFVSRGSIKIYACSVA
jgi:hypothetical protein